MGEVQERRKAVGRKETDTAIAEENARLKGDLDDQATEIADTVSFYHDRGDFDIPVFEASFPINNRKITTNGTGFRDKDGFTHLFYIAESERGNYIIFFSVPSDFFSGTNDIETFHDRDYIKDLFRSCLIF